MASTIPKEVKKETIDLWIAETWKAALFASTSNCLTQSLYSACTNELATAGGYTQGGISVTKLVWGGGSDYVDTVNAKIDAVDVNWGSGTTFTARYVVVYNTTNSKIRAVYDLVADKVVTNGTFTIQWNTAGLVKIS